MRTKAFSWLPSLKLPADSPIKASWIPSFLVSSAQLARIAEPVVSSLKVPADSPIKASWIPSFQVSSAQLARIAELRGGP